MCRVGGVEHIEDRQIWKRVFEARAQLRGPEAVRLWREWVDRERLQADALAGAQVDALARIPGRRAPPAISSAEVTVPPARLAMSRMRSDIIGMRVYT